MLPRVALEYGQDVIVSIADDGQRVLVRRAGQCDVKLHAELGTEERQPRAGAGESVIVRLKGWCRRGELNPHEVAPTWS